LEEVYRILKPSGVLFIFSPNRWFPFETHGVQLKPSGRRVPHWIPLIPYIPLQCGKVFFDYWARNYWQGELGAMVKATGFSIIERTFVWLTFEDISGRQPWFIT
jgi:SAM-dependent methyltransferase